jgi:betaine-aldehyde dehydrogenase
MAVAEQTPAPVLAEPVTTVELRRVRMLIDGTWVESMSGEFLSVENPAKRCPIGGKSPSIVYPDADEDWVVDGVIGAMRFTRQSQSCTAGSRLFLHADIFESFLDKLRHRTALLKLGDPLDEATDIGAIINEKQFRKVCAYIEEGLQRKEGQLMFGGLPPKKGPLSEGYFAIPTVFADASNDWRLAREEIFGPVLVAIPGREEADAIRMDNDSHYGLAAYVWTHDIGSALRTAHVIESG